MSISRYYSDMLWNAIKFKHAEVVALCHLYRVQRLAVFGSAAREDFDPDHSDVDFLVEFKEMSAPEYADAYFGLREGLEELFDRRIDLVTESSMKNPYFRRAIEASRTQLYAA